LGRKGRKDNKKYKEKKGGHFSAEGGEGSKIERP